MKTKTCTKCGESKPLNEYNRNRSKPDGYAAQCKVCRRKGDKEYRDRPETQKKRSKYRKATRGKYKGRYKGRYNIDWRKYSDAVKAWHDRNPLAKKAYKLVYRSIARGEMPKASECSCAHCGGSATEYHHHRGYGVGYELDVIPLCHSCHKIAHSEFT